MLTVAIDFKSPASYLALEPTLDLAQQTGVPIEWLPFSVRPFAIPEEKTDETVGERHRRTRALAQRDTHLHYAAVQGRPMQFSDRPPESNAALAALAALDRDPVPLLRAAFSAYWTEQADLDDETVVATLLASLHLPLPDFGAARAKLASLRARAAEYGIFDTPSYVIAEQLFLGREHLPWIGTLVEAAPQR